MVAWDRIRSLDRTHKSPTNRSRRLRRQGPVASDRLDVFAPRLSSEHYRRRYEYSAEYVTIIQNLWKTGRATPMVRRLASAERTGFELLVPRYGELDWSDVSLDIRRGMRRGVRRRG